MSESNINNEVDVKLLFAELFKYRFKIIALCLVGGIVTFALSFLVPVTFKSQITVLPQEQNKEMNAGSLMGGNLGGLASIAGIDLGGSGSTIKVNMEILKSRQFILDFVKQNNLEQSLVAAIGWNRSTDQLVYDETIFDVSRNSWVIEDDFEDGKFRAPNDTELYEEFMQIFTLSFDTDTQLLSLAIKHVSPNVAQSWLTQLVKHANEVIREDALQASAKKVSYLYEKLEATKIESIKNIFYQLIESEMQNKMLIDTKPEYAFKVIDPAFIPDEKYAPKRAFYLIFGALGTFFVVFGFMMVRFIIRLSR